MNILQRVTAILATLVVFMVAGCSPSGTHQGTGEYIDDALITSKVKTAFAGDPSVKTTEIQVETFRGTVQLSGFVDSLEDGQKAEQVARTVKGVTDVRNNTTVKK